MSQYGITNTKEVLTLAFGVAQAIKDAKANDGRIDMNDLPLMMALIPKIQPAFSDIKLVPKEIMDLDADEAREIQEFVMLKFGKLVSREQLVDQVNKGLIAIVACYEFVQALLD